MTGKIKNILLLLMLCSAYMTSAQNIGILKGRVTDAKTGEPLIGAAVMLVATYKGDATDFNGDYAIREIKPGDYTVKVTYLGYQEQLKTGITISNSDEPTILNFEMNETANALRAVEVVGDRQLLNLQSGKSEVEIGADQIEEMNAVELRDVVATQNGVTETPDGIQIRGGRIYETEYVIDGISASDPLAGTGFGVEVNAQSIQNLNIVTSGVDVEYGSGTSGLVAAEIKDGSDSLVINGSYFRDNIWIDENAAHSWNTENANVSIAAPIPFTKKKLQFYTNFGMKLSDNYFGPTAEQLKSSILGDSTFWSPRQANSWNHTIKFSYRPKDGMRFTLLNQHSLSVNQSTRSLQIIGNDQVMQPGFQYPFSLDMDNAQTYTHKSNLTVLTYRQSLKNQWWVNVNLGRLFVNLRADANGRPFRNETIDRVFDPESIVTDPVSVFNPNDSIVFVNPGPGLYNNDGIATLWHDHYVREYTGKIKFEKILSNVHFINFGWEHKEIEYQWIDVTRPWIGAPIQIDENTTTVSTSLGSSYDVWKVNPAEGGFFVSDRIEYKGIIATLGMRFNYWAPGKFIDTLIDNENAPILDPVRDSYNDKTLELFGRSYKARLLPRLNVSFPVTENNVLYFNYGHSMQLPHPRFVYAGLDPQFQDGSFLSNLGNPDIEPEVSVNYEVGLKTQITSDLALSVAAFYNDKYDYIVSRTATIQDQTGRFVRKTFFINQDYARIRGIEVGFTARIKKYFLASIFGSYQVATGKSNTATESRLQIEQNGFVPTSTEVYLAWDRPFELKSQLIFTPDENVRPFGISLKNFRAYFFANWRSGQRYTPYEQNGVSDLGRPIYEIQEDQPFAEVGSSWFTADIRLSRDFPIDKKGRFVSLSFEIKNLFDNRNAQIVNPVTGTGYQYGDPLPFSRRDPLYPSPQDNGTPPENPARWRAPRQFLYGIRFQF